jgi:hypothetical protein
MKKAPSWLVKLIALASTVTIRAAACQATSIIIDVEADSLVIVADSRAGDSSSTSNNFRDDQCKIVVLGKRFAFAGTGNEGYAKEKVSDPPGFHRTTEALRAYSSVPDHNLHDVALSWSRQLAHNFQVFYLADPQRVRGLATAQGILCILQKP